MASNIFKFFQSPQKPASSRRTSRTSRTSLNSAASGSRGVKRKGKTDPYDDMGAGESIYPSPLCGPCSYSCINVLDSS